MDSSCGKPKNVTLTFFNIRGRGEPIRMLLLYGDVTYKEHTVDMPPSLVSEEWSRLKPSKNFSGARREGAGDLTVHADNKSFNF